MCIQFSKSDHWLASATNIIGNGLVITGVVAGAAIIVKLALQALRYSGVDFGKSAAFLAGTMGMAAVVFGVFSVVITALFICAVLNRPMVTH